MMVARVNLQREREGRLDLRRTEQLARFLAYVLGRRPDEFGLVTDGEGFVPTGDLLKVAHEEGWPRIRRSHLETLNYHVGREVLDFRAHRVRAADRSRLAEAHRTASACPKVLYAPIRRRAYEAVAQHGLRPQGHTGRVVLFGDRELAEKIGRRRDSAPVLVTVNVANLKALGYAVQPFAGAIFLTDAAPPECCRLPRAPQAAPQRQPERETPPQAPKTPGSFFLDPAAIDKDDASNPRHAKQGKHRARSKDWKRQRQKARRWKQGRDG